MIARFLRRGQFLVVLDGGVVIGLAAAWADFLIDSALFPGVLTGLQFVCHIFSNETATLRRFFMLGQSRFFQDPCASRGFFV